MLWRRVPLLDHGMKLPLVTLYQKIAGTGTTFVLTVVDLLGMRVFFGEVLTSVSCLTVTSKKSLARATTDWVSNEATLMATLEAMSILMATPEAKIIHIVKMK